jgi:hypothetical protein
MSKNHTVSCGAVNVKIHKTNRSIFPIVFLLSMTLPMISASHLHKLKNTLNLDDTDTHSSFQILSGCIIVSSCQGAQFDTKITLVRQP